MNQHQPDNKPLCLRFQCIEPQKKRCQKKYKQIPCCGKQKRNPRQLFEIIVRSFRIPVSHTLSDHCDKYRPHRHTCQCCQRPDALRHSVSRNLISSKKGHNAAKSHLHQLEYTVFQTIGDSNPQNFSHGIAAPLKNPFPLIKHLIFFAKAQPCNHRSRKCPGNERRICDTRHTCMKHKYAD